MKVRKLRSTKAVPKRIRDEEWKAQADAMTAKRLAPKRDKFGRFIKKEHKQFGNGATPIYFGPFSNIAPKKVINPSTENKLIISENDPMFKIGR